MIISGDITDFNNGIIIHQVNCQNKIGAGVSGAIIKKYPIVKEQYHQHCGVYKPTAMLGTYQEIKASENLIIINSYTQLYYGNSTKTHKVYTNMPYLIANIKEICDKYKDRTVYVPYLIGCGLAGGNWDELYEEIKDIDNLIIVRKVS